MTQYDGYAAHFNADTSGIIIEHLGISDRDVHRVATAVDNRRTGPDRRWHGQVGGCQQIGVRIAQSCQDGGPEWGRSIRVLGRRRIVMRFDPQNDDCFTPE